MTKKEFMEEAETYVETSEIRKLVSKYKFEEETLNRIIKNIRHNKRLKAKYIKMARRGNNAKKET